MTLTGGHGDLQRDGLWELAQLFSARLAKQVITLYHLVSVLLQLGGKPTGNKNLLLKILIFC